MWKLFFHSVEKSAANFPQCGKLEVGGQRIAVEHQHRIAGQLGFHKFERATSSQRLRLARKRNLQPIGGARREVVRQHVGQMPGGQQHAADAVASEPVELPFKEGAAGHGYEAFGPVGKVRGNPGAFAAQ